MDLFHSMALLKMGKKLHYLHNMWRVRTISFSSQSLALQNLVSQTVLVFASWPLQSVKVSRGGSMNNWWVSYSLQFCFGLLFFFFLNVLFIYLHYPIIQTTNENIKQDLIQYWPLGYTDHCPLGSSFQSIFDSSSLWMVCSSSLYFNGCIMMNLRGTMSKDLLQIRKTTTTAFPSSIRLIYPFYYKSLSGLVPFSLP